MGEAKSVADVLREARKLIEKPEAWAQGESARDASGRRVPIQDPKAVCFCAVGAIWKVSHESHSDARRALAQVVGNAVAFFNDSHTHAEVLAAFDAAISRAEA